DVAVFNAAPARLRDIKLKGRIVQRLAVASGKGAVEPCDGSQFSWLGEQRIAGFQFEHIGAALEHPGVEAVGVGDSLEQEIAAAKRPLLLIELGCRAVGQAD